MDAALKKNILIGILAVLALLLLAAVGLFVYFKLQFTTYQDDQYHFSMEYPKTWQVIVHPKENVAVVFVRPKDTALDTVQENFNITVQDLPKGVYALDPFTAIIKNQMTAVFADKVHMTDAPIKIGWRDAHELMVDAPQPDHLKMVNAWVLRSTQAFILTFLGDLNKYPQDRLTIYEMIHSLQLQ